MYFQTIIVSAGSFFVAACNILSSSVVSLSNIEEAHMLMQSCFIAAEELYGPKFLTINAHLHLHLHKVYLDYGPCKLRLLAVQF